LGEKIQDFGAGNSIPTSWQKTNLWGNREGTVWCFVNDLLEQHPCRKRSKSSNNCESSIYQSYSSAVTLHMMGCF